MMETLNILTGIALNVAFIATLAWLISRKDRNN